MINDTESRTTLPRLITARDLDEQTGIPLARVFELARKGKLPAIRFGRSYRFDPTVVSAFFAAGGTGSLP